MNLKKSKNIYSTPEIRFAIAREKALVRALRNTPDKGCFLCNDCGSEVHYEESETYFKAKCEKCKKDYSKNKK